MAALDGSAPPTKGRRRALDPVPHFKCDEERQLDALHGCPELIVPEEHLARQVWSLVSTFDLSKLEQQYSSLGRRGYPPRRLLALWIYASLVGEHHASKLARRCQTDMALRWLCGGHAPSASTLNRFRRVNGDVFEDLLGQTVALAEQRGLLNLEDLAGDSARIRAHAGIHQVRTLKRSRERVAELEAEDLCQASEERKKLVKEKLEKHRHAIKLCEKKERSNVVLTSPGAGLMKFPYGASLPGHRLSVMAAGLSFRLVIGVLIDASTHDYGKVKPLTKKTLELLRGIKGLEFEELNAAFDAGYATAEDLSYLEDNDDGLNGVIKPTPNRKPKSGMLGRKHFIIRDQKPPLCPAGREMAGPYPRPSGEIQWRGIDCERCTLKSQCTKGKTRSILVNPPLERMRARFAEPKVKARYSRRVGTVEPVFSSIEDTMGFRRVSSRHPVTVRAELLLKVLAHNVSRLLFSSRVQLVHLLLGPTPGA